MTTTTVNEEHQTGPGPTSQDVEMMSLALDLAAGASMETAPNPRVGCVLVKDGQIIGRGCTQKVGQAHAEVMALRDAASQGHAVQGATAYVTLEPCSHYGRTPPCANALIEAGVARVVAALEDPNPLVAGRGFAMLREAGIDVLSGVLAQRASELNIGFLHRMRTGKPWVRLKMAASMDGFTALPNRQSQWITDAAAREDGHHWRARADAILTGIGTVLADNPQMNIRYPEYTSRFQPRKIVVDSRLRIHGMPNRARLLESGRVLLVHAQTRDETLDVDCCECKVEQDCEIQYLHLPNPDGTHVDLSRLMQELGREQINEMHVEAGAQLSGALLAAGLVDELLLYLAPKFLGSGRTMFDLPGLQHVEQAQQWTMSDLRQVGNAVRVILRA
ncbi:bifunctional diaminohydroxyphosphoribosylaminopyrimidine deaminase/5-amino-6-(5-phosphoribosylamino)uracil reductase RibD [Undibacterium cyanobacteriorum]|uniref:Riboflavin biosynthesis protein RibD n=1 Tax=Undibacterium cyanobacteriorum TaxID=3073561 RepID=A0ABY9RMW5_9BURK|nr:bifunctional diaminohydroxyphosphoribosylaminopyrimidine deaminase/5-amino-6-(5-phosphoribosylamino)uracil reductase RibD [Undibacterium sp. 20NA77.5]WMW81625.1 bifunctional diaminohydroxyphosphoribosylaminopyrimidine deaminase/5-amino-6-(5-phosphoribosylamino)uracil reductase RibD [Undibacterium sp. 20NA77.5]